MRTRNLLLCATAVVALGCGSDSTEPTVGSSGSLSYTYTGAGTNGSASYSATGAIPANPSTSFGSSPWAGGSTENANEFDVVASIPRSSTSWDLTVVTVPGQTTGTFPITSNCTANVCADVLFLVGASQNEQAFTYICGLSSGSITISTLTTTHATGSFSGTGSCLTQASASSSFAITNGTFDVGVAHTVFGRKTRLSIPLKVK